MLRTVRQSARTLRPRAAHDRLGRRDARRGDLRLGPRGARAHHQRVLRPDRVQSRALVLRGDRRRQARRHRQAGSGPHGRHHPRRTAPRCEPGELGQIAVAAARPGDVPRPTGTSPAATEAKFVGDWMTTGDQGDPRRGRLCPLRRARRRRHHLGRLPHRPRRDRGLPDPPPGGGARRRGRQARSGAHGDRQGRSSC